MDIAERLEQELEETNARLRHDVTLALLDDGAYAVADTRGIVDEVDGAQRSVEREMTLATRSRLRERAHRLVGALERLRDGLYGVCEECEGEIAPARLAALPEVTTCVVCQERLEMAAARGDLEPAALFTEDAETADTE
jgi:RNA polymerase-binding transcription factor DksA